MIAGNRIRISTTLLIFMVFYPHAAHAETLKSAEFLTWKRPAQESYINTSIGMAGLIAAQNDKKHANCLENWYWDNQQKSTDFILKSMREYSAYHPRGVILAVLEAQCGKFDYINWKK